MGMKSRFLGHRLLNEPGIAWLIFSKQRHRVLISSRSSPS